MNTFKSFKPFKRCAPFKPLSEVVIVKTFCQLVLRPVLPRLEQSEAVERSVSDGTEQRDCTA